MPATTEKPFLPLPFIMSRETSHALTASHLLVIVVGDLGRDGEVYLPPALLHLLLRSLDGFIAADIVVATEEDADAGALKVLRQSEYSATENP